MVRTAIKGTDDEPDRAQQHTPTRVPFRVYTDPEIFRRELDLIFGPAWNYVALAAEIPNAGDFRRTTVGRLPVVVVRDKNQAVNVLVNRCAHRGVMFCTQNGGNAGAFTCPYHQWTYDTTGRLLGVPFRNGVDGRGGMPADFERSQHWLERLTVTERHGVIFATTNNDPPTFEEYLGEANLAWFDRVFDGRSLRILGYERQRIPANWKLMFENIKDPYHASLLHVFLVSFGLFRADNPSATQMDRTGRHSVLVSSRQATASSEATTDIKRLKADLDLQDPRLIDPIQEYPGDVTVVMQTIWPNLIVQQQSNTLAMRQLVPVASNCHELHWTFFGYQDDDEAMTMRRLRQANLMGPAGLVSIDDSEVMRLAQLGAEAGTDASAFLEMGGRDAEDTDHVVTEAAIRAFYGYYERIMAKP